MKHTLTPLKKLGLLVIFLLLQGLPFISLSQTIKTEFIKWAKQGDFEKRAEWENRLKTQSIEYFDYLCFIAFNRYHYFDSVICAHIFSPKEHNYDIEQESFPIVFTYGDKKSGKKELHGKWSVPLKTVKKFSEDAEFSNRLQYSPYTGNRRVAIKSASGGITYCFEGRDWSISTLRVEPQLVDGYLLPKKITVLITYGDPVVESAIITTAFFEIPSNSKDVSYCFNLLGLPDDTLYGNCKDYCFEWSKAYRKNIGRLQFASSFLKREWNVAYSDDVDLYERQPWGMLSDEAPIIEADDLDDLYEIFGNREYYENYYAQIFNLDSFKEFIFTWEIETNPIANFGKESFFPVWFVEKIIQDEQKKIEEKRLAEERNLAEQRELKNKIVRENTDNLRSIVEKHFILTPWTSINYSYYYPYLYDVPKADWITGKNNFLVGYRFLNIKEEEGHAILDYEIDTKEPKQEGYSTSIVSIKVSLQFIINNPENNIHGVIKHENKNNLYDTVSVMEKELLLAMEDKNIKDIKKGYKKGNRIKDIQTTEIDTYKQKLREQKALIEYCNDFITSRKTIAVNHNELTSMVATCIRCKDIYNLYNAYYKNLDLSWKPNNEESKAIAELSAIIKNQKTYLSAMEEHKNIEVTDAKLMGYSHECKNVTKAYSTYYKEADNAWKTSSTASELTEAYAIMAAKQTAFEECVEQYKSFSEKDRAIKDKAKVCRKIVKIYNTYVKACEKKWAQTTDPEKLKEDIVKTLSIQDSLLVSVNAKFAAEIDKKVKNSKCKNIESLLQTIN